MILFLVKHPLMEKIKIFFYHRINTGIYSKENGEGYFLKLMKECLKKNKNIEKKTKKPYLSLVK